MEPLSMLGGFGGLQKREYLAKRETTKEIRKGLYFIFKP
jgi:hypothetical protein